MDYTERMAQDITTDLVMNRRGGLFTGSVTNISEDGRTLIELADGSQWLVSVEPYGELPPAQNSR